nr:class I SAM-dependent methyltransferase [Haladaptatus caseinilyticus]
MTRFQNTGQPDWDWWERLWPAPSELLRTLGVESGETVAEVGCGNGYFVLPAAERAAMVYAVDMDDELLAELEAIAENRDLTGRIETICGDARILPFLLPASVSFALVANVLHGVGEKRQFLRPFGRFSNRPAELRSSTGTTNREPKRRSTASRVARRQTFGCHSTKRRPCSKTPGFRSKKRSNCRRFTTPSSLSERSERWVN